VFVVTNIMEFTMAFFNQTKLRTLLYSIDDDNSKIYKTAY
jgi:hypothetical protein